MSQGGGFVGSVLSAAAAAAAAMGTNDDPSTMTAAATSGLTFGVTTRGDGLLLHGLACDGTALMGSMITINVVVGRKEEDEEN